MKSNFFNTLFSGTKKSVIDASSFDEARLAEVRDANEAQFLLKHAIDSKQETHIIKCLNVLYRMCHDNPLHVQQFGENGSCALVDQLLGSKFEGTNVYKCSLQVIYMLITKEIESKNLSSKQNNANKYWGGIASFNLNFVGGSSSSNFIRFSGSSTIFRMVKMGNVILQDNESVIWMLKTILVLSEDQAFVTKFVPCGGCELIGKLLKQYHNSDAVIELSARLVHNLILSDLDDHDGKNEVQVKFQKHAVCDLLGLDILQRYKELSPMSISGTMQAIGSLARRNDDIKGLFLKIGTLDLIISISESHCSEESQFVGNFFWCLANLTFPNEANQKKLIDAGIGNYVLHLLDSFQGDQEVVEEGLRSLRFLMHDDLSNIEILANNGMIALLMKLMRRHADSPQTLQWITFALVSAADSDLCLNSLHQEQVGAELIASVQRFAYNTDYIQWVCMLISKLAKHGDILNHFYLHHLDSVLLEALKNNNKDAETLEEVLHAIHSVIDNADETKMRFVEYGLLEEVMGIIFSFDGNELLVELGLQILRTLFDLSNHLLDRVVINESSSTSPSEILPYSWRDIESNVQTSPHLIRFKHIFKKLFVQSSASSSSNKLLSKVIGKYIQNASIVENGCAILTSSLLILSWSEEQVSSNDTNDTNHVIGIIRTKKIQSTSISPLPSFPSLYLDMLKYHFQNLEICKLCLLGLLQLFNFENLANPLLSVDCCQLVLQTLDTHYGQDLKLLMLSYNVIIQLSVDAKCRKIMSQSHISNVNIILTTLAHYVHHLDAARLGCMTISAVCISPVDDALHTFRRIKYSRLLQSRQTSNEITQSDETSTPESSNQQNTENAKASTTTSSTDAYNLTAWLPSKLLNFQNNADGFSSELAQVNFFHLDTLCILDQSSSANKMIIDAAATIISSGLSDQEEKSILNSREKAEEKRGNGDSLVTHGGLLILLTLLQIHKGNHQVLVHTMNAINSIFLTSLVRSTLFIDKLTEELIEAIQHFQTSRVDELVLALTLFTLGSWCVPSRIKNSNDSKTFVDTYPQRNKLLELGFVDILGSILETYLSDALLVEISCRNLHFLTDGNEQIKLQISQNMVSETLVRNITSCFESHSMNSTAIHYICLAISGLAFDNKILQGLFQDRQIYQLIESCLKRKLLDVDVCQSCCRAIYALKDLNPLWYECSVAELVVSGLNQHIQDVDAVEWIFKAIGSLAEFPPNKEIMDSNGVCKSIATAMHRHVSSETIFTAFSRDTSSAGVAQWGCAAIYYLAKGVNGRDFQEKLVTAGVCDSVARALVKYSELEYVAFSCCRALVVLLINNEPLKTKFGAAGVCSCIVESLHLFPSSTNVAKWGCRAVAVLAENHESNIAKLGVAGACETIPLLLQSHPSSEHIAGAGCDVIAFMSETLTNRFAVRFGHAGACEAVVSVVRKHYENHNVLVRACVALAALARVVGNSRWFGPTGACEALQSALRHHVNDSRTVRYIVTAAGNLCIVNHNRNRFGMLGFCGDLCHILQLHILDPDCAKACISTIWKLCENEDERSVNGVRVTSTVGEPSVETDLDMTEEGADELPVTRGVPEMSEFNSVVAGITNRDMFAQSGLANLIIEVMKRHMNKIDVMQAALRCLAILCTGKQRTKERDEFGLIGVCPVILDIMRNYSNDSMITLWGSFAIRALTESNQSNRLRFFECSMPSLLIKLLNSNKSDGFNQNIDAIICAISNLAIDCKENKLSFGENGACELLLEYLELNFRSIELCYLGLRALNAVVLDCEENVLKLSFSNAGETLMVVISRYPDEDGIVVNSLALVSNLTTNKVGFSRLSSNGILKIISLIQSKLERSNDSITFHACELIANLSQHATWQEKFGQLGLCKTLSVVLSRNLMIITKFDADQVRKDSKTANTMEINNIISILVESCRALVALVTENEANKQKFLSHGTLEVLTSSLESGTKIDETLSNAIIQAQSSLIGML